jgi:hypothetical protein
LSRSTWRNCANNGRDAGLPETLWRPLTEWSVDALPGATIKEKVLGHLERIGVYVQHGG